MAKVKEKYFPVRDRLGGWGAGEGIGVGVCVCVSPAFEITLPLEPEKSSEIRRLIEPGKKSTLFFVFY